jgi:hypothetical protein
LVATNVVLAFGAHISLQELIMFPLIVMCTLVLSPLGYGFYLHSKKAAQSASQATQD